MALSYDQITAVTQKRYIPKLVDNIFDSDPLLKRARQKGWYESKDGGTEIVQPLMYAQVSAAGSYSPNATLDTTDNESFTAAEFQWKFYYANITISGPDELKNTGDARVLDFVKNKVMVAEMTLKDLIGDGIYSDGSSATDIGGLRLIIDDDNTVGGISQSDYAWWQSELDGSTTTFSIPALQTQFNTLSINGKHPSVGIATRANYNRYYNSLQPAQRFVDSETAKGGFQSLMFNGIPFIVGSKAPANHVIFLNEEFIHLYYHPKRDFVLDPFLKTSNQDARTAKVFWMGNMGSSNNRMHGRFSALSA